MNQVSTKPYLYLLGFAIAILAFGWINWKKILDINIGDTYYIIKYSQLCVALSFLYFMLGFIYFVCLKYGLKLDFWLTVSHVMVSISGLIIIWLLFNSHRESKPGDIAAMLKDIYINNYLNYSIIFFLALLILSQVLFVINVIMSFAKNKVN